MAIKFEGVFPPITTPFEESGGVAIGKLEENIDRWNATDLSGYVVLGSNGEACLLEEEEKERVISAARKRIPDTKGFIIGTGLESTAATIRLTQLAADSGADAVLVGAPHYYKNRMTDEALEAHFRRVADASPVPVLLYSVPDFTGVPLNPQLVSRLAEHPQIAGMKYSTRDMGIVGEILRSVRPGFRVFIGTATVILPAVSLGACGAIVAVACPLPELTIRVYRASLSGPASDAAVLQSRLAPPATMVTSRYGIAGLKAALDCSGYYGGKPRLPLLPLTESELKSLSETFAKVAG